MGSSLKGRCYNPQLLKDWLKENSASWPSDTAAQAHIQYLDGSPSVIQRNAASSIGFNPLIHRLFEISLVHLFCVLVDSHSACLKYPEPTTGSTAMYPADAGVYGLTGTTTSVRTSYWRANSFCPAGSSGSRLTAASEPSSRHALNHHAIGHLSLRNNAATRHRPLRRHRGSELIADQREYYSGEPIVQVSESSRS